MKNYKIEIKWALIFVVAHLLWMGLENLAGLHTKYIEKQGRYTLLFAIPAVLIYVLALRDKRNNFYNGVMTWKQGFYCGLAITLIIAACRPITELITHKIIAPSFFSNIIEYGISQGESPRALAAFFNLKSYIVQAVFGTLSLGIVTAAAVAWFVKRK